MGKNSFLLYLAVGFAMTMAVWGLMGGCSSEKSQSLIREEPAPDPELVKIPTPQRQKLPIEEVAQKPPVKKSEKAVAAPKSTTTPKVETVKPPVRTVTETRVAEHVVQKGETLWGISQKYRTTVETIMELNQMKGMGIHVGQRLRVKTKVPEPVETYAAVAEEAAPAPKPVASAPVSAPAPQQPVNIVAASQPPVVESIATAPVVETPAPAAPVEIPAKKEEVAPQPYTGELLTHEVKDGETLSAIASEYRTSKSFLQDINGLTDNSELQPGQILLVPEKTKP